MNSKITLRPLRFEDLSVADELRHAAGWNQTPADWRRLLSLDPEGCFAAVDQDKVVGTATTTSYGTGLAWIGMVLVHPSRRNQGIGRQLLTTCLEYLRGKGVKCIKLDATPAGQILYETMGFQVEWPLDRWMKAESGAPEIACPARVPATVKTDDWDEILQLDRQVFGGERAALLRLLGKDSIQTVVCRGTDGGMEGFGFLRSGVHADYIGPVVAQTEEAGQSIAHRFLHASLRPLIWDIPAPCAEASAWAAKWGFVRQRPLGRMYLGKNEAVGLPQNVWGISDPATG
jgi:ribosomal protein S18 acetylase RimI-like enzyme